MTGRQLVVRKTDGPFNVKEAAARIVLRKVRQEGHEYVELREVGDGKKIIFFCTLCLSQCFSDSALWEHLRGNPHKKRYAAAQKTLFGPLPWPFNDGILFFYQSPEKNEFVSPPRIANVEHEVTSKLRECSHEDRDSNNGRAGLLTNGHGRSSDSNDARLNGNSRNNGNAESENCSNNGISLRSKSNVCTKAHAAKNHDKSKVKANMIVPNVLVGGKLCDLKIQSMGIGHISSSYSQSEKFNRMVYRVWCAWLGEGDSDDKDVLSTAPDCDFAIVNFSYRIDLGRRNTADDLFPLLSSSSYHETDDDGSPRKRIKKSFSDPEESSAQFSEQCDSSTEGSPDSNGSKSITQRPIYNSSKAIRRELRRRERLAAERMCDICRQKMLPGKDVAALLNLKTGKLACCSRNQNGAFHVFHISCLLHWILLCEFEMWNNGTSRTKGTRGRRGKRALKGYISSIFCPECQGTGIKMKGVQLESPRIQLYQVFLNQLKAIQAHKSWMEDPEPLAKCSTGLHFACEELQDMVLPSKLLHFYRADVDLYEENTAA